MGEDVSLTRVKCASAINEEMSWVFAVEHIAKTMQIVGNTIKETLGWNWRIRIPPHSDVKPVEKI
jgi:hypothetical protein